MIMIEFVIGIIMLIFGIVLILTRGPFSKLSAKHYWTNFTIGGWLSKLGGYDKEFYDYNKKWEYRTLFILGILGIIAGIFMIIISLLNFRTSGL